MNNVALIHFRWTNWVIFMNLWSYSFLQQKDMIKNCYEDFHVQTDKVVSIWQVGVHSLGGSREIWTSGGSQATDQLHEENGASRDRLNR